MITNKQGMKKKTKKNKPRHEAILGNTKWKASASQEILVR